MALAWRCPQRLILRFHQISQLLHRLMDGLLLDHFGHGLISSPCDHSLVRQRIHRRNHLRNHQQTTQEDILCVLASRSNHRLHSTLILSPQGLSERDHHRHCNMRSLLRRALRFDGHCHSHRTWQSIVSEPILKRQERHHFSGLRLRAFLQWNQHDPHASFRDLQHQHGRRSLLHACSFTPSR